jgi:hypothetical protein
VPLSKIRAIILRHWTASRLQPSMLCIQELTSPTRTKHPNGLPTSVPLVSVNHPQVQQPLSSAMTPVEDR